MKKTETVSPAQSLVRILFLAYCGLMLWLLFGQRMEGSLLDLTLKPNGENINLLPFATVRLYWHLLQTGASQALLKHAIINLVGNVVMFVPLGWFLPGIWRVFRGFFKTVIFGISLICLVELLQYLTGLGSCDVDDLILNTVGIILGYSIWKLKHKK